VKSLRVFAFYHKPEVLAAVPDLPFLVKGLMQDVRHGDPAFDDQCFGEGRLFLSDLVTKVQEDYIGIVNGRSHLKYANKGFTWDGLRDRLSPLLAPRNVVALWPTDSYVCATDDWLAFTDRMHPGMADLVVEMLGAAGVPCVPGRPSLWANDFVCHRTVFYQWLRAWRTCHAFAYHRWGKDLPISDFNIDPVRKPAYLLERATTAFFASRTDLTVVEF
jgi:hypothetical protein